MSKQLIGDITRCYNAKSLQVAIETINSFVKDDSCKLYLWDEDEKIFIPRGEIKYALIEFYGNNQEQEV